MVFIPLDLITVSNRQRGGELQIPMWFHGDKVKGRGNFGTVRKLGNSMFVAKEANRGIPSSYISDEKKSVDALIEKMNHDIRQAYTLLVTDEETRAKPSKKGVMSMIKFWDKPRSGEEELKLRKKDPQVIILSKLCDGQELLHLLKNGKFNFETTFDSVAEACINVVSDMHRIKKFHCDIKPENVMMCAVGGGKPTARIIDFGLMGAHCNVSGTPCYNPYLEGPRIKKYTDACYFKMMMAIAKTNKVNPDIFAIGHTLAIVCCAIANRFEWPLTTKLSLTTISAARRDIVTLMMTRQGTDGIILKTDDAHWSAIKTAMTNILKGTPVMLTERKPLEKKKVP